MSLLSVIESIVGAENIKRAGKEFKTYSIFNPDERTPSFFFTDDVWKDYSTDKGGNAVTLVMDYFDKTKEEAIVYLADNFNATDFKFERKAKTYNTFNDEHTKCQEDAKSIDMNKYFFELFNKDFISSLDKSRVMAAVSKHIGYSKEHDSLTVSLFSGNDVVQIKTRKTSWAKWVGAKGSNGNFITYNVIKNQPFVLVVSGMAEILICEMMGLPYIGLQSDGAVKHIDYRKIKDKEVIVIEDNDALGILDDNKFQEKVTNNIDQSKVRLRMFFDFRNIFDKAMPKGYDFRDFCNQIKDYSQIMELLKHEYKLCRKAMSYGR